MGKIYRFTGFKTINMKTYAENYDEAVEKCYSKYDVDIVETNETDSLKDIMLYDKNNLSYSLGKASALLYYGEGPALHDIVINLINNIIGIKNLNMEDFKDGINSELMFTDNKREKINIQNKIIKFIKTNERK